MVWSVTEEDVQILPPDTLKALRSVLLSNTCMHIFLS